MFLVKYSYTKTYNIMKLTNDMHFEEVQNLLAEFESLQKVTDQFYSGNIEEGKNENNPTRQYNISQKSLDKITPIK